MLWETSRPDQEKSHFINSFTDSLLDSFTQHLAEDVLAEQWNLSIYHVLGVCQQLHKGWETLNGKDTSPDLNFLMYGVKIQSADLSLSQRSLTPINLVSQDSRKTMPPLLLPLSWPLLWLLLSSGYRSLSSETASVLFLEHFLKLLR